jgi:hypothetical protein
MNDIEQGGNDWFKHLQQFCANYNSNKHSGLKIAPNKANNYNVQEYKDNTCMKEKAILRNKNLQRLATYRPRDNYYFEHISDGPKIKPFYDIDSYASSKEELAGLIEFLKSAWETKLAGLYREGSIAVASSHGMKENKHAVSFHFVISGYETTMSELRNFNEAHQLY